MAEKLNTKKVALSLGILFAIAHTLGVIGILAGFMKYWQWAHFITVQHTVTSFSFGAFAVGIIGAFAVGLVIGAVFAAIYNKL